MVVFLDICMFGSNLTHTRISWCRKENMCLFKENMYTTDVHYSHLVVTTLLFQSVRLHISFQGNFLCYSLVITGLSLYKAKMIE